MQQIPVNALGAYQEPKGDKMAFVELMFRWVSELLSYLADDFITCLVVLCELSVCSQCELLAVHGADPCVLDCRGHTPVECARSVRGHWISTC